MADDNVASISEESKSMLEEHVKKGKARKFILINKGSQLKTLIVFKKGPYGPKVKAAKKAGFRGDVTCGVITGRGINVVFQLPGTAEVSEAMKAEGNVCESEPCKIAKLREFMKDEGGLQFKPEFQVIRSVEEVAAVSELDDDEADLQAQTAVEELAETGLKDKLVDVLKKMTSSIQQAVVAFPDRKDEILAPAARIKGQLQADQLEEAKQDLLSYREWIQGLLSEVGAGVAAAAPVPPPPPPGMPGTGDDSQKSSEWNWRLAELTPKLKQVLGDKLGDYGQVATLFKEARAAQAEDVDRAVELLKQCATLVEAALAPAEEKLESAGESEYRESWESMAAEFPSQRQRIAASGSADQLADFERFVAQAQAAANQNSFQQAVEWAIRAAEIETAARKAAAQDDVAVIPEGKVAEIVERVFNAKIRWDQAIAAARREIAKVQEGIRDADPQLAKALDRVLGDYAGRLDAIASRSRKASTPEEVQARLNDASRAINALRDDVSKDVVIEYLDTYQGARVQLKETFQRAFRDLDGQLNELLA